MRPVPARAVVPLLPEQHLATPEQRDAATAAWVEAAKTMPPEEGWAEAERLAAALGVSPNPGALARLCLSWDEVANLAGQEVEFGGHTGSHPISESRVPAERARQEIAGSLARLRGALGERPLGFACPNRSRADYTPQHKSMVSRGWLFVGFYT